MLSDNIKIGDRVEICLKRDKILGKPYVSLVSNKTSSIDLVLDIPISFGQLVMLKPGDGYWMMFFTENGMYSFDAKIEKHFKEDGFHMMAVQLISKGDKVQRRDFYRYECLMPMKFSVLKKENEAKTEQVKTGISLYEGEIKDISGGGIRFVSNEDVNEGNTIKCAFMLDTVIIGATGKVLYKETLPHGKLKFQYRIQFVKISVDDQESIVKYIFMQQRKALGRI